MGKWVRKGAGKGELEQREVCLVRERLDEG